MTENDLFLKSGHFDPFDTLPVGFLNNNKLSQVPSITYKKLKDVALTEFKRFGKKNFFEFFWKKFQKKFLFLFFDAWKCLKVFELTTFWPKWHSTNMGHPKNKIHKVQNSRKKSNKILNFYKSGQFQCSKTLPVGFFYIHKLSQVSSITY